jgi:hypothetical protein
MMSWKTSSFSYHWGTLLNTEIEPTQISFVEILKQYQDQDQERPGTLYIPWILVYFHRKVPVESFRICWKPSKVYICDTLKWDNFEVNLVNLVMWNGLLALIWIWF